MKKILLILILLSISLTSCTTARQSPVAKIREYIENAEEFYKQEKYNQALVNLEKALQISKNEFGEKSGETAGIYLKLADFSITFTEAISHLKEAEFIYQELSDMKGLAKTYNIYGSTYVKSQDIDLSENAYKEALRYCDLSNKDTREERFYAYFNLAGLDTVSEEDGLLYYQEAEKLLDILPDNKKNYYKMRVYNNLGNSYYNVEQYDLAIRSYEQAIEIWLKYKEGGSFRAAQAYDHCGFLYALTGNSEKAFEYINKSLNLYEELKEVELWSHAVAFRHMSVTYALNESLDYDKAMDYGLRSCKLYTEQENLNSKELEELKILKEVLENLYNKSPFAEKQDFESWYTERINQ